MSGAIKFAEELGLAQTYDEVINIEAELKVVQSDWDLLDMKIRNTGDQVNIARDAIANRVYEENAGSEVSFAALDRMIKAEIAKDPEILGFTRETMVWREQLATVNTRKRTLELEHRSRVARMNAVGGYLNFMAAAKRAEAESFEAARRWPLS